MAFKTVQGKQSAQMLPQTVPMLFLRISNRVSKFIIVLGDYLDLI
jgi:hypothetical protein